MCPRLIAIASIALLAYSSAATQAQSTTAFTYQGQVKSAGSPINGLVDLRFRLYDAPTSPGNQIGPQVELGSVAAANGLFTVPVDFTADAYRSGQPRWLEVDIRSPAGSGAFTTLGPRQPLTPTPFALNTRGIDVDVSGNVTVGPLSMSSFRLPSGAAAGSVLTSDEFGFGTWAAMPCVSLPCSANTNVSGCAFSITNAGIGNAVCGISTAGTGVTYGIYGRCDSVGPVLPPGSAGVFGEATAASGYAFGVQGISASDSGRGVFGWATSPTGGTHGVLGQNNSTAGIGVRGEATAATGITYGGFFNCNSTSGRGLFSRATATSGSTYGVFAENYSPNGRAVYGKNFGTTGPACGVYGESFNSTSGQGVFGLASALTGSTYGVYGEADSSAGTGVYGTATANSGSATGVWGVSSSPTGAGVLGSNNSATGAAIGVHGYSISGAGSAVVGTSTAPTGTCNGVLGETSSNAGTGVYGSATAISGFTYGVYGLSASGNGAGILGTNTAANGSAMGVAGYAASDAGVGVIGYATSVNAGPATGVTGVSYSNGGYGIGGLAMDGNGTNYAVYGSTNSPSGNWAGYFVGNVNITGSISKGGGTFKIDHPLDPENKYLYHSFVESPDMKNIYDGVVTTDARGYATVTMPTWFGALNRDFRYQLTVIDAADSSEFVQAKIVQELNGNQFTLRTSSPSAKVSWQVTGIRQDAFANAHRAPVEVDKPVGERGQYLYPVENGKPIERGIDAQRTRRDHFQATAQENRVRVNQPAHGN